MFTQRHYIKIAQLIKDSKETSFNHESILDLTKMFINDNERFKPLKFLIACGYPKDDAETALRKLLYPKL